LRRVSGHGEGVSDKIGNAGCDQWRLVVVRHNHRVIFGFERFNGPYEREVDRDLGFGNDPPETGDQLVDIDMRTASSQWRYGVHHVI
jgi:hypothetical protein